MAVIETKFSIGDVVYRAGTHTTVKMHDCPDCLGSRKWKATSPAGGEYEFGCPRCCASYVSNDALSLRYTEFDASVQRLTIGSVRTDSTKDHGNEYMCLETGVGSGSLYYEADLFHSEEEAFVAAKAKAAAANLNVEWVAKLYDKTLKLSDYELSNAVLKAASDSITETNVKFRSFWDEVEWSDSAAEIKEAVEKFRAAA